MRLDFTVVTGYLDWIGAISQAEETCAEVITELCCMADCIAMYKTGLFGGESNNLIGQKT